MHRDWYFIADQPAPAPHLAHPEGCAALRIALVTVPRVSTKATPFQDYRRNKRCKRGSECPYAHGPIPTPYTLNPNPHPLNPEP